MAPVSSTTPVSKNGYVAGAIVRVKMTNFMTYSDVEVHLGPRMNVVVGPNGTGKSTILCAICLGLGGKPGLIGRATAFCDYIKHGFEKATIEIELCNVNDLNYIVRREILKNNQSVWSLNDAQSSQKVIDDLMDSLNIQMKNLCQFLPQDRVADFVKMSPQELLENTEKAIGNLEMWESHMKLKKTHLRSQTLENNFTRLKTDLETEMQHKTRLEEQANVYHERRKHLENIRHLNTKKAWLEYENARQRHLSVNKLKEKTLADLHKIQESLNPLRTSVNNHQKAVETKSKAMEQLANAYRQKYVQARDILKSICNLKEKSCDVIHEYKSAKELEETRLGSINSLKQQLLGLENELTNCAPNDGKVDLEMEQVSKELQKSTIEIDSLQGSLGNASNHKRIVEVEHQNAASELRKINDVTHVRLENLRRRHRHAYEAAIWLRENQNKFKKIIHGPIMTVINVRDLNWAKYVERQIPFKDMVAFVCEDVEDLEIFMKLLRDEQNLKINVVMAPEQPLSTFQPRFPISDIQKWGFHSYLREMVEAPDAVLGYLCAQLNFHEIPVGNKDTKELVPRILEETPFRQFYTADHQFVCIVSRYGSREKSTRCSHLESAKLLTSNLDVVVVEAVKEKLKNCDVQLKNLNSELKDLQQKERRLQEKVEELRVRKKDLMIKKNFKKNLMVKIEQKKLRIKNNEEGKTDLNTAKQQANLKLQEINNDKLQLLVQNLELTGAVIDIGFERASACCEHAFAIQEKNKAEKELHEHSAQLSVLEREVNERKQEAARTRTTAKQLLTKARELAGTSSTVLPEALQHSLPDTLDELESEIHHLQAQADCLIHTDESALENYEHWRIKVTTLEDELQKKQDEILNFQQDISEIEQLWLPPLMELIHQISSRFGRYFESLGCAGEVGLFKGENEKDYSKYGISIKVKFRANEPLRELTSSYQSGGERSVATILYLLALQEFIKLPFCCVDEINQGMDSLNEQRVMQLMTETLCTENFTQYLLVTPKLLRTSNFGDHVTVLIVFNGAIDGRINSKTFQ